MTRFARAAVATGALLSLTGCPDTDLPGGKLAGTATCSGEVIAAFRAASTAAVREDLWTRGRAMAEERTLGLPDDPALLSQLNGVRKLVTAGKHDRFDIERNSQGHGDLATGFVLMLCAAGRPAAEARWVPGVMM